MSTDFPPRGRRSGYDTPHRPGYYDEDPAGAGYDTPERSGYDDPGSRRSWYRASDGYGDPRPRRSRHAAPDGYDSPNPRKSRFSLSDGYAGLRRRGSRYSESDGYDDPPGGGTATRALRSGGRVPRHGDPEATRAFWGGGGRRARPSRAIGWGGGGWGGGSGGGRWGGGRSRHWTWRRLLGYAGIAAVVGLVIVGVLVGLTYSKTPIPTAASQFALSQQSTVYFSDGKTPVGTLGNVNRRILQPDQIPPVVQNAVLSAEDRNFYHEGGVSPTGILRALYTDLTGGSIQQGGSTITQEFVRNYYANIGTQQTFTRKFKEIFVATKVARKMTKSWILTQYLNTIDFGRAWGVGAASETYFGKPIGSLDTAQAAELAAIIQLPNFYSTPAGHGALEQRWNYVLDGMQKMGTLSPAQRPTKMPPFITQQQNDSWSGYRGYIMEAADYELKHTYGYTDSQIQNGGLKVRTTFDKSMEDAAYNAVTSNISQMKASGAPLPKYTHIGMTVIQPSGPNAGGVVATYSGKNWAEQQKQCAVDYCQEDMALAARNQVGSSFKPYVLATAVNQGISIKSILDGRSPLCIPPDTMPTTPAKVMPKAQCSVKGTPYSNWYGVSNDQGDIPVSKPADMTNAIAYSLNTAFVDLTHQIGTNNVIKTAESLGVDPSTFKGYGGDTGIAIGINSLSTEEQASTFATFASGGWYVQPHVIRKLTDGSGNNVPLKITRAHILNPQQAGAVDYALSKDTVYGTAKTYGAMSDGRPIIGKTGTTENAQAAWFVGAIPQYAAAVAMFTNDQSGKTKQSLTGIGGLPGYGGDWPTKIWHSLADAEFANLPIENFPPPFFGGRQLHQVQLPKPKPKPKPKPTAPGESHTPKPKPTCDPLSGLCGKKHTPSPTPCIPGDPSCGSPQPTNSPPPTLPLPGGGGGGGGRPGGGGTGAAVDARQMGGG